MIPLAVFGDPIAHSLSPRLHQVFASQVGLQVDYRAILAPAETFADQVRRFFTEGGCGANVTLPHKQTALQLAAQTTPVARQAGAANTLWMENGQLHADNTDGIGLVLDLHRLWGSLDGFSILILGSGGAARGIIGPLLEAGVRELVIKNRTPSRAEQVVADIADKRVRLYQAVDDQRSFDAVINASAAGHSGTLVTLQPTWLSAATHAYDLSYGTAAQPFLQAAKPYTVSVNDGLGMLVGQGLASFQRWTGQCIDFTLALQCFRDSLDNPRRK